ncbi:acetyl-CoA C-acetyltransferase [Geomicrobium sp. JCM 19055]|uniref:thiolase family protein n=1 Tax=Geomicrobium sp. JCM 19055 TaxID=1460649 RepID=UPI00045ED35A|nr:acetyl-CoA C-acetyltransferase [Geomicrobium sp. JCM 19055]GAJ98139.1 3-ketoacyl-CoA thiolase [Geomicrobium sp. JCM 19055]
MNEVYLVEAKRTAIGTFIGSLKGLSTVDLAVPLVSEMMEKTKLPKDVIDEVIVGNVFKAGVKGNPARQIGIHAGLSEETPAMTIDKQCASGLRAITLGAMQIGAGESNLILAGGAESMTNVPRLLMGSREGQKVGDTKLVDSLTHDGLHCAIQNYHMGVTAENLVRQYNISREEQDEFAYQSQVKALKAIENERFKEEIVPLSVKSRRETITFDTDEGPRQTSVEKLGKLSSVFEKDGTVTAGNASGLNDGAAFTFLASKAAVDQYNLKPVAKIKSYASAAVDPSIMGIGPVPATKKALERAGMSLDDIDLFEFNEAFASQVIAVNRELNVDESKINVNGGAIALGHPVGCSGARIVVTLLHELQKQQKQHGLASLCVGGGQGVTIIVEAL